MKFIDIVFDTKGNITYSNFPSGGINQYATDYQIRVGFSPEFDQEEISTVTAAIKTNKTLPTRALYPELLGTMDIPYNTATLKLRPFYSYDFTFYDTQFYQDSLEITVIVNLKNGIEFNSGILYLPMNKADYNKPILQPLDYDSTLNNVLKVTTETLKRMIGFIDKEGVLYDVTVSNETGTVMLRDVYGRSKVSDPEEDTDVVNKKYADGKVSKITSNGNYLRLYGIDKKGEQITLNTEQISCIENFLVQRSTNGQIYVPEDPTANGHSTSKKYVDNLVNTKTEAALKTSKDYTDERIDNLVDSAPGVLDTLNELSAALGDDPNFATTIINRLTEDEANISNLQSGKVDKVNNPSTTSKLFYGVDVDGTQTAFEGGYDTKAGWIVQRNSNGQIIVPENPGDDSHAASKVYVDNGLSGKLNKPESDDITSFERAVTIKPNTLQQGYLLISSTDSDSVGGRLATYRTSNGGTSAPEGRLVTGTPTQNYQAATKKYVDDVFNGAINSKIAAGTGINISSNGSNPPTYTISTNEDIATMSYVNGELQLKQGVLEPGEGISIDSNNKISNTKELYSYILKGGVKESTTLYNISFLAPKIPGIETALTSLDIRNLLINYIVTLDNNSLAVSGSYGSYSITNGDTTITLSRPANYLFSEDGLFLRLSVGPTSSLILLSSSEYDKGGWMSLSYTKIL